jgi:hypothetical protein
VLLFLAGWAPWLMFPERTMFYFYSIVYLPFLVIAIAYIANLIYVGISARESSRKAFFVIGGILLVVAVGISVFFYPVWTGIQLPKEVNEYLAYSITSNVRELEGALISLLAQSSLNRKEIDLDLAKKVLRNFVKSSSKEITIDTIQKMVCEYFDVPYDKLLQKTRKREIVQARQITMYLAKAFTKNSLKTIGEHFGGRDHTTVIHSCQTVKDLMDTDGIFRENVLELQQKVQLAAM